MAVLTAGVPARGYVWCQAADGSARVETGASGGRCSCPNVQESASHEEVPASLTHGGECVDASLVGGIVLTRGEIGNAPAQKTIFLSRVILPPVLWTAIVSPLRTRTLHLSRVPIADRTFVAKTVVILV